MRTQDFTTMPDRWQGYASARRAAGRSQGRNRRTKSGQSQVKFARATMLHHSAFHIGTLFRKAPSRLPLTFCFRSANGIGPTKSGRAARPASHPLSRLHLTALSASPAQVDNVVVGTREGSPTSPRGRRCSGDAGDQRSPPPSANPCSTVCGLSMNTSKVDRCAIKRDIALRRWLLAHVAAAQPGTGSRCGAAPILPVWRPPALSAAPPGPTARAPDRARRMPGARTRASRPSAAAWRRGPCPGPRGRRRAAPRPGPA